MNEHPYILMVAPDAPPKLSAEAIQVRQILEALDGMTRGRLVSTSVLQKGWVTADEALKLELDNFDVQRLSLPFHGLMNRVLHSHRLSAFIRTDAEYWITYMSGRVLGALPQKPDIIYSRSQPHSAALLAYKLKNKLNIPWIMHLSDPWADNTSAPEGELQHKEEAECFKMADAIMLTTQGQADFYRKKYPELANKIHISSNVLPVVNIKARDVASKTDDEPLHMVFAGSMYGKRTPEVFIEAIRLFRSQHPSLAGLLKVDFYGNIAAQMQGLLDQASDIISCHGRIAYDDVDAKILDADIALSIEEWEETPLSKSYLTIKMLNYISLGKAMLALAFEGSEAAKICDEGYGWAVAPSDTQAIAAKIAELVENRAEIRKLKALPPPDRYQAQIVVRELVGHMNRLIKV